MIIGEIYIITNIQNNKVYIGQTIRPVEYRFILILLELLENMVHKALNFKLLIMPKHKMN